MPDRQLSLAVVGIEYPNKRRPTRRFEVELCRPGEPVELRREPKNPADPRAVAVFSCRDVQLGYLTAERAPYIGRLINKGSPIRAIFQARGNHSALIRVSLDGSEPKLPRQNRTTAQEEPDWGA